MGNSERVLPTNNSEVTEMTINTKEVKKIVDAVKREEKSKSLGMVELHDMGMLAGDIAKTLGVRYNFVYNVVTEKRGSVHKKNKEESKSEKIREYANQGLSTTEICKEFAKNGIYVNYNMVRSVVKKHIK